MPAITYIPCASLEELLDRINHTHMDDLNLWETYPPAAADVRRFGLPVPSGLFCYTYNPKAALHDLMIEDGFAAQASLVLTKRYHALPRYEFPPREKSL